MKQFFIVLSLLLSYPIIAKDNTPLTWKARKTSVSGLTPRELKNLFGSLDVPVNQELFHERNSLSTDSIDWRNHNGQNWIGPMMNQGNCGSCVAFAAVATLETQYKIGLGIPWLLPTFSPQHLFSCGGGSCNLGWRPAAAALALKNNGIVDSACSPYVSGSTGLNLLCGKISCEDEKSRTYKISNYSTPTSMFKGSAQDVKMALKNGPLMTTMNVHEDFLSYGSGIYKTQTKKTVGGHAISLVGFNDSERYWIIRNSWGTDWGEEGYARVSYDDPSGIASNTWALETKKSNEAVEILSPSQHEYISGQKDISVKSVKPISSQIFISGEGENLTYTMCENELSTNCKMILDSTQLRDGRYEIYAKNGNQKTQVKEFYVINNEPSTSVKFSPSKGDDISKPIRGRLEFDIDIKSNPIMPAVLRFVVEDMNGKVVGEKITDVVLAKMKLGFRFNTLEPGQYKIYYSAETPFNGKVLKILSNIELIKVER